MFDGNATDTGFSENDGDLIGTFRDTDGSVYKAGAQIVKDILFHSTPNCVQRTNWKMMACEETFGQVSILLILHNFTTTVFCVPIYICIFHSRYVYRGVLGAGKRKMVRLMFLYTAMTSRITLLQPIPSSRRRLWRYWEASIAIWQE